MSRADYTMVNATIVGVDKLRYAGKTYVLERAGSTERICHPITEIVDDIDVGIGILYGYVDYCSACGAPLTDKYSKNTPYFRVLPKFCPDCGAKVVK